MLLVWGARPLWLPAIGTALEVRDPLAPADAIVVLGGNAPQRLRHALGLYQAGYAPRVVISNEQLHTHGTNATWRDLYEAGLAAPELPPADLLLVDDPPPESTIDEARRVAKLLRSHGLESAILVTDHFHSRRAMLLFAAEFRQQGLTVRSSPAEEGDFPLDRWWQSARGARTIIEEYGKLLWYVPQGVYW